MTINKALVRFSNSISLETELEWRVSCRQGNYLIDCHERVLKWISALSYQSLMDNNSIAIVSDTVEVKISSGHHEWIVLTIKLVPNKDTSVITGSVRFNLSRSNNTTDLTKVLNFNYGFDESTTSSMKLLVCEVSMQLGKDNCTDLADSILDFFK